MSSYHLIRVVSVQLAKAEKEFIENCIRYNRVNKNLIKIKENM